MDLATLTYELSKPAEYLVAAIIGVILGSFYTASASRTLFYFYGPGRKSSNPWRDFLFKPSHCMACRRPLSLDELLPIVSFLALRGRCRSCESPIGWYTLTGELFPGILLPLLLWSGGTWLGSILAVLLCGQLYISIATDTNFLQLDHENALFLFLWAFARAFEHNERSFFGFGEYALVGFITGGILLMLFLGSRLRGLGMADILLGAILGLGLGFPWILVAVQFGAVFSLVYIYFVLKNRKAPAPFGTGMALGAMVALVSEAIWNL